MAFFSTTASKPIMLFLLVATVFLLLLSSSDNCVAQARVERELFVQQVVEELANGAARIGQNMLQNAGEKTILKFFGENAQKEFQSGKKVFKFIDKWKDIATQQSTITFSVTLDLKYGPCSLNSQFTVHCHPYCVLKWDNIDILLHIRSAELELFVQQVVEELANGGARIGVKMLRNAGEKTIRKFLGENARKDFQSGKKVFKFIDKWKDIATQQSTITFSVTLDLKYGPCSLNSQFTIHCHPYCVLKWDNSDILLHIPSVERELFVQQVVEELANGAARIGVKMLWNAGEKNILKFFGENARKDFLSGKKVFKFTDKMKDTATTIYHHFQRYSKSKMRAVLLEFAVYCHPYCVLKWVENSTVSCVLTCGPPANGGDVSPSPPPSA